MHRAAVPARARRGLLRPLPAMDLPFLILVLTLVGFGLVMLYSASSAVALYRRGDAWAYVRPQLLYAAMGIGAMWAASRVDYHIYHKLAWPLLALSLVLLVVVLFMPEYNGCKRWLVLPGLGTLQPSEIAKFAVVLVFAHIISLNHSRMESFAVGVVPFALVLGAVAVLMLLEPHLSGTVLILGIGAVLMFVGGTGLRWFVLAGVGGAGAIGAAIVIMPDLVPYAASRLSSWLDPFADPLGDGHQTIQSLYAIGSGGAVGLGLGNSRQKHLFVPEPQNDFIFSILCEELGFVEEVQHADGPARVFDLLARKIPVDGLLGEQARVLKIHGLDLEFEILVIYRPALWQLFLVPMSAARGRAVIAALRVAPAAVRARRLPDRLRVGPHQNLLSPAFELFSAAAVQQLIIFPTVRDPHTFSPLPHGHTCS